VRVQEAAKRAVSRTKRGSPERAGFEKSMQGMALGGFGVGLIEKNFGARLPTIPMFGRKGTIAVAAYFLKPKEPWMQKVGLAAAAMAGYEFGKDGKISGEDVMGDFDDDDDDD